MQTNFLQQDNAIFCSLQSLKELHDFYALSYELIYVHI